jgi:copper chaperone CopZ
VPKKLLIKEIAMQCGHCKSSNTKRLEMIYDQGTYLTTAESISTGYDIVSSIKTVTKGRNQSSFASTAAPPTKHSYQ